MSQIGGHDNPPDVLSNETFPSPENSYSWQPLSTVERCEIKAAPKVALEWSTFASAMLADLAKEIPWPFLTPLTVPAQPPLLRPFLRQASNPDAKTSQTKAPANFSKSANIAAESSSSNRPDWTETNNEERLKLRSSPAKATKLLASALKMLKLKTKRPPQPIRPAVKPISMKKTSFLDFPFEIRRMIYEMYFPPVPIFPKSELEAHKNDSKKRVKKTTRNMTIEFDGLTSGHSWTFASGYMAKIALFQVCRQMRHELFSLVTLQISLSDLTPKIDQCILGGCCRINEMCFARSNATHIFKDCETGKFIEDPVKGKQLAYVCASQFACDEKRISNSISETPTPAEMRRRVNVVYTNSKQPCFPGHIQAAFFFRFKNFRFVEYADAIRMERELRKYILAALTANGSGDDVAAAASSAPIQSIEYVFNFSSLGDKHIWQWDYSGQKYLDWVYGVQKFYTELDGPVKFAMVCRADATLERHNYHLRSRLLRISSRGDAEYFGRLEDLREHIKQHLKLEVTERNFANKDDPWKQKKQVKVDKVTRALVVKAVE